MNQTLKPVGYAAVQWNVNPNIQTPSVLTIHHAGKYINHKENNQNNMTLFRLHFKLILLTVQQIFLFLFAYALLKITSIYFLYATLKILKQQKNILKCPEKISDKESTGELSVPHFVLEGQESMQNLTTQQVQALKSAQPDTTFSLPALENAAGIFDYLKILKQIMAWINALGIDATETQSLFTQLKDLFTAFTAEKLAAFISAFMAAMNTKATAAAAAHATSGNVGAFSFDWATALKIVMWLVELFMKPKPVTP